MNFSFPYNFFGCFYRRDCTDAERWLGCRRTHKVPESRADNRLAGLLERLEVVGEILRRHQPFVGVFLGIACNHIAGLGVRYRTCVISYPSTHGSISAICVRRYFVKTIRQILSPVDGLGGRLRQFIVGKCLPFPQSV